MHTWSAAEEPSGTIIAGTGSHEKTFYAPRSVLEKSTVIKDWIKNESISTSMRKGDALYFPGCDPEVVHATIEYLKSTTDGLIDILNPSAGGSKDVLFYVKMYKFALCLRLNKLCDISLGGIKELTCNTKTFLHVLSVSIEEKTSLVDDPQFRNWMVSYVTQESKELKESDLLKHAIMRNSELAWRLCSLLISSLGGMGNGNGAHTPPNKAPPSETTPEMKRRKSPYSYQPQQKSPSPRQDINRIKKPQTDGVRKFSATVKDAIDREYLSPKREPDN